MNLDKLEETVGELASSIEVYRAVENLIRVAKRAKYFHPKASHHITCDNMPCECGYDFLGYALEELEKQFKELEGANDNS